MEGLVPCGGFGQRFAFHHGHDYVPVHDGTCNGASDHDSKRRESNFLHD